MTAGIVLVVVLVIIVGLAIFDSTPMKPAQFKKCVKQPDKACPVTIHIDARCRFHFGNHSKCCKVIDQIKAANEMGCKMEVGVDYNGMSITQSYKDSCLRSR